MNIGIIGSRRRNTQNDCDLIEKQLINILNSGTFDTFQIVSGGCPKGGDRFAEVLAKKHNLDIIIYPADWKKHGKGAGFIRNTDIARESDVLIACVSVDRTGGTEDTIRKFLKMKNYSDKLYLV